MATSVLAMAYLPFASARRPEIRRLASDPSYDPFALGSEQPAGARSSSKPQPGWARPHLLCKALCCGGLHMLCLFSLPVWGPVCLTLLSLWWLSFLFFTLSLPQPTVLESLGMWL